MKLKHIVFSTLGLAVLSSQTSVFAAIKATSAEDSAIKVVRSSFALETVKDYVTQFKTVPQTVVNLDTRLASLEKSHATVVAALPTLLDEASTVAAADEARTAVADVVTDLKTIETFVTSSGKVLPAAEKSHIVDVVELQKELGPKVAAVVSTSKFAPIHTEAKKIVAALSTFLGTTTVSAASAAAAVSSDKENAPEAENCSFCDQSVVNEGDRAQAALVLKDVLKDFAAAADYFAAFDKGTDAQFNVAFGCSSLGDVSIDLSSADLALGLPDNKATAWRTGIDSLSRLLIKANQAYACP